MIFGCCIVLYNPDSGVSDEIEKLVKIFDYTVVVDNSDSADKTISTKGICNYIRMNGNEGIAAALNKGFLYLIECGCELVFTIDQDSRFPFDKVNEIFSVVEKYYSYFDIISLGYKRDRKIEKYNNEIIPVNYWITSGNFVKTQAYKRVSGYMEELFIDSVDHEFCRRIIESGGKIGVMRDYKLQHKIGAPKKRIIIFGTAHSLSSNHSSVRYYYIYRNIIYLHSLYPVFYRKLYVIEIYINFVLLFP